MADLAASLRSTLKAWLPPVLGFVAITIPLTWLWLEFGRQLYARLFAWVAPPLYALFGLGDAVVVSMRLRYINVVPFVGLMLVTPGLSWPRRLGGLAVGLGLLFFSHLWLNATAALAPGRGALLMPAALACDVLPFLLWILLTRRWPRAE